MNVLLPLLLGTATGILSAWGIGGGTLLLLAMTLLLGVEQSTAQQINLLFFLPTAAAALFLHRKNGYLKPEILKRCIPWGVFAAAASAALGQMLDTALLRRPFGVFLLFAAVSLWRSASESS